MFVVEQQIPPEEELDEADATAIHAIALQDGQVIGTGRMLLVDGDDEGTCRIGRMAVDREWRRHGVGGQILVFLEEQARQEGLTLCLLHAQEYVKAFYSGHGYVERGAVFMEAGFPTWRWSSRWVKLSWSRTGTQGRGPQWWYRTVSVRNCS